MALITKKHPGPPSVKKLVGTGELPVRSLPMESYDELGEVVSYDATTNSYVVITHGVGGNPNMPGQRKLSNIPRKTQDIIDASPLVSGTTVIIRWSLGFPFIDGVLNVNVSRAAVEEHPLEDTSVSGGTGGDINADTNSSAYRGAYYRDPMIPKDILPGDKIIKGPDGNFLAICRGGYTALSGGSGCKALIEAFADRDLIRLVCEHFHLLTAFGSVKFFTTDGRTGIQIRGGKDTLTETGGTEEQWTFKFDLGETGDYLSTEICDASGNTKAKFNITDSGKISFLTTDGFEQINGGSTPSYEESAGGKVVKISGDLTEDIRGSVKSRIKSGYSKSVSGSYDLQIGNSHGTTVQGDSVQSIGGNQSNTIFGGSFASAKPTNIASSTQILNGSYHLEVGNPLFGANPAAVAGMTFAVNNGVITLGQNPNIRAVPATNAIVNLNTRMPSSVALGGTAGTTSTNPALYHGVMYEPLLSILTAMMAVFDTHGHPPFMTPPVVPMSAAISPMLSTAMSLRVMIGG